MALAVRARRRIEVRSAVGYWIAQIGTGLLAAEVVVGSIVNWYKSIR